MKTLVEAIRELTVMLKAQYQNKGPRGVRLIKPANSPRYDEVYDQGIKWLDSLAGSELSTGEKIAEFSDEVWKSSTRKAENVS